MNHRREREYQDRGLGDSRTTGGKQADQGESFSAC